MHNAEYGRLRERIHLLEGQVEHLFAHLGLDLEAAVPPPSSELDPDVAALVDGGQLIQAVKRYRERTGLGLKEAQAAIQAHARSRAATLPAG
jgi:ribosomal protein L7/L12